jgi:hypothetical protein
MRKLFCCLMVFLAFGCSSKIKDEPISLEKVPDNTLKIAKERLPTVNFEQAIKRSDGSYEVRGKDKNGKIRDIDISARGEILEVE